MQEQTLEESQGIAESSISSPTTQTSAIPQSVAISPMTSGSSFGQISGPKPHCKRTGGSFKSGAVMFNPPLKQQKKRCEIVKTQSSTFGASRREQASNSTLIGFHLSNFSPSFNLKDSDCSLVLQEGKVVDLHLSVLCTAWPSVRELVSNPALLCYCGHTCINLPWAESSTVKIFRQLLYTGHCDPVDSREMFQLRSFLHEISANMNLEISV